MAEAHSPLCHICEKLSLDLRLSSSALTLSRKGESVPISAGDLDALLACAVGRSREHGVLEYEACAERMMAALKETLLAVAPGVFDPAKVAKIAVSQGVPYLEAWSAETDVSFQGGGSIVSYPNPYLWDHRPALVEAYERGARIPGRVHLNVFYAVHCDLPHEFVHCLQSVAGVREPQKNFYAWTTEHDASYLCLSIFDAVARREAAKGPATPLFPLQGLPAQIVLEAVRSALHMDANLPEGYGSEFVRWRDSLGLAHPACFPVPQDTLVGLAGWHSAHFKNRVAIEGRRRTDALLRAQIEAIFNPARWAPGATVERLGVAPELRWAPHYDLAEYAKPLRPADAEALVRIWASPV